MNIYFPFLLGWLCCSGLSSAQNTLTGHRTATIVNLKIAPLSLLDPDATVQGAIEIRLKASYSIQAEFGYGNDQMRYTGVGPSPWTSNNNIKGKEIWRTRLEGRYYLFPHSTKNYNKGLYIAIEGLYKQVSVTYQDTLQARETITPVFVYAPVSKYEYGLHNKIGKHIFLSYRPDSFFSKLFLDVYTGLGARYINVVSQSPATDRLFQNKVIYERFMYSDYRPGDSCWRFSISLGLKIGVSL